MSGPLPPGALDPRGVSHRPLVTDDTNARARRIVTTAPRRGRTSQLRVSDFQTAAIAVANRLALYTLDADDFAGIDDLDLHTVDTP